MTLKTYFR